MMDLIPMLIDGAVVFNLQNDCSVKSDSCESCIQLALNVHNWIKQAELGYVIFDLQDEKDICRSFLAELLQLRKRMRYPFIFVGVMEKPQEYLESFHYPDAYPLFSTPEDAIRALRMQHPGVTENPVRIPVEFGAPMANIWRQFQGEQLGV